MKWKHKINGWEAATLYYLHQKSNIYCYVPLSEGKIHSFTIPYDLIEYDNNWEEIPDGRWLDYTLSAREFMEAFAMTITDDACGHDSFVVKMKIDKSLGLIK